MVVKGNAEKIVDTGLVIEQIRIVDRLQLDAREG
jgi:hypothetical protein